ncbi:DEAD/DEAH box helicase [Lacisediminihabitans sp. G11-30]|uniref:DEAD/DEAH box helicase n=2 Tax=Lacisediminihabitans changchengi TaxID=2787634 RepID=A0A934SKS3_9MICO|nr:DEAD/DEAH box helicase [Lacisediminihabitans changchengi]
MRTKGFYFEKLVQQFLLADPVYAGLYEDVWLWQDWPGRDGKPDTGIDLVARRRYSGDLVAIQCKFFGEAHTLQKDDIDSFFTASGKQPFAERIVVSTTSKWSKNAEDALDGQQIPTHRIGLDAFEDSPVEWDRYSLTSPTRLELKEQNTLRKHQREALADVVSGFDEADRGKLIMACGTGKTFTSLKIAESTVGAGGSVLFLVPSIALLSQTLREWTAQSEVPIRAFAVCSDTKVGKSSEDFRLSDLEFPATTDATKLIVAAQQGPDSGHMTVYFSTYQSIAVISEAQKAGLPEFDLVICDEAHRTTGVTLADDSDSAFVRVHDADFIRASRRLYMTATPKIYGEALKSKAKDSSATIASMDDVALFGPEFHRLGFGEAVERELLTDYRVLVLAVSEEAVSGEFQQQFQQNGELNIDDAARIAGIYNALAKRGVEGLGEWPADRAPMRRAVAFSRSIKDSQRVSALLDENAALPPSFTADADSLTLQSRHVDGTMNVLERTRMLDWLKEDAPGNHTRILTNARCLSEGVDVPSLDAVIFLNSRDSQVDVVQSVGRVMRKSAAKDYGYIILPIAVPAGIAPELALSDNAKYKVVWDVLRALRAHDERFEAKIESLDLNRSKRDDQLQVIGIEDFGPSTEERDGKQVQLDFTPLGDEWREAVYAKIVQKVGEREYWENWASSVADVAAAQTLRIEGLLDTSPEVRAEFERFLKGLQDNLNPSVSEQDALEMLAQHIITQPVLEALFDGFGFAEHNPVAKAMQGMLAVLEGTNVESETRGLESFYDSVRARMREITDPRGKQDFLKTLYQRFFSVAMRKASERLGIVYTPTEIVDFILRSADDILRAEFDSSLGAEGVNILDPFTGTGTFLARLIQSDLISDADLPRKYRHELHANEINLLAYYVAAVNLEDAYQSRMGGNYVPFDGILLTDTFQMHEEGDELDSEGVFVENNAGVIAQKDLAFSVIVGNPPYSKGQESGNDDNQNVSYPSLDDSIKKSYAARSSAQNKNNLYDSYIRAIRWASERIGDSGIVGFVTNGGFIDGNTADGMRKVLVEEFSSLYVLNLRGNARTAGEQRRKERDNVFGQGTRTTVAVAILVKNPSSEEHGQLRYHDIGDYLSREEKLALVAGFESAAQVPWTVITPNTNGDWENQRSDEFHDLTPLMVRRGHELTFFYKFSAGLQTNRDAWVYNYSRVNLSKNIATTIAAFNENVELADALGAPADLDSKRISWSSSLLARLANRQKINSQSGQLVEAAYRPFQKGWLYFDKSLNHRPGQLRTFFVASHSNLGFFVTAPGESGPFASLMTASVPDLHVIATGQFFPRYTYEMQATDVDQLAGFEDHVADEYTRIDNVTDEILSDYRTTYGPEVTKDDIFFYVYGILHSSDYRERFAADLKKLLPRIPKVTEFREFSDAGRSLSELHIGYEDVEPYALDEVTTVADPDLRVTKMRFAGKRPNIDRSTIIYNDQITLRGIPDEAHEYMLGSRSAIEWILERYQVKTDKPSGIVNDPNAWGEEHGNPRYILDLLKSIVTVSVETVRIVKSLPPLDIIG